MENDVLLNQVLEASTQVHQTLGPGFIESVYSRALVSELKSRGLAIQRERQIKIWYRSEIVGKHILDLVVAGAAIVELKAANAVAPVHIAQLRSYLQATDYPFGLVLNFGAATLQCEVLRRES